MAGIMMAVMNVVQPSIVVVPDPVLWIDANDAASYPGSGTTITDLSGNGHTQNLSNAAAYTVLGGVKCWDTSSSYYIRAASVGPTLPTTGFTYIAWARMKASSADYRTLFRTSPNDHPLLIKTGTNDLGMWDNDNEPGWRSTDPAYDVADLADIWVQWAVSGDSSGQTFYINGQEVGTTTDTAVGNAHDYIGGLNGGQSFGYIANTFLYNTSLSQAQIRQIYEDIRTRMYNVVTFTATGTTSWTAPAGVTEVEYLVVGGGGGGGNGYDSGGGGGGGGGMALTGTLSVTPGQSYTVTVGAGGTGGINARTNSNGTAGNDSVFATVTALGGGLGYGSRSAPGGVRIGGAAQVGSTTSGQGGNGGGGGGAGGGGGGATGAGGDGVGSTPAGTGGTGLSSSITGSAVTYGGGGNGGTANAGVITGATGAANTGKGGGAGSANGSTSAAGGNGGSGIVVVKYGS